MAIRHVLFLGLMLLIGGTTVPSDAAFLICQNGKCDYANEHITLKPWLRKLYCFFKTPDARIDFCEADPKTHTCLYDALNWTARSPATTVYFSVPVARSLPYKNTLLLDYLVTANVFQPSCGFSTTTFEEAKNNTLRMVSHAFECQLTGVSKINLQSTFYIDYIDFDNSVIGGQYAIQTHGEINSTATGYTLMKFRDGKTLLPLVPQPYFGEIPSAPNPEEVRKLAIAKARAQRPEPKDSFDSFIQGVQDWWEELKESFNLDRPKVRLPNEEPHWWDTFSEKFLKVFYLQPLD